MPVTEIFKQWHIPQLLRTHPLKKALGSLYKCIQERKLPQVNLSKAVEPPPVAKPMSKAKIAPAINNAGVLMNVTQRHG